MYRVSITFDYDPEDNWVDGDRGYFAWATHEAIGECHHTFPFVHITEVDPEYPESVVFDHNGQPTNATPFIVPLGVDVEAAP